MRLSEVQNLEDAGQCCGWNDLRSAELLDPVLGLNYGIVVQTLHAVGGAVGHLALDSHETSVVQPESK